MHKKRAIDCQETFSLVVRYSSIRLLIVLAAKYDLLLHHMDVTTAYLQGELDDEIYAKMPENCYEVSQEQKVFRLKKAMYGLKQSGRAYNRKLCKVLTELSFTQSKADQCVFHKKTIDEYTIIAVYVDDLLIATNNEENLRLTKQKFWDKFKMKDLGEARNVLGMRIISKKYNHK